MDRQLCESVDLWACSFVDLWIHRPIARCSMDLCTYMSVYGLMDLWTYSSASTATYSCVYTWLLGEDKDFKNPDSLLFLRPPGALSSFSAWDRHRSGHCGAQAAIPWKATGLCHQLEELVRLSELRPWKSQRLEMGWSQPTPYPFLYLT